MYAADALQEAIYMTLDGFVTGSVFDRVPPGSDYPYTVIRGPSETPDDEYVREGTVAVVNLNVYSAAGGNKEVMRIFEEIDSVLHQADLVVYGFRCWDARRTFSDIDAVEDIDTGRALRFGVARYRFAIEPI